MATQTLVTVDTFDIENVIFGIPEETPIKESEGVYYKVSISYMGENGEESFFMLLPKVYCYGLSKDYGYGRAKEEKNFKGYNLCYYTKDPREGHEQTEEQQKLEEIFQQITDKLAEHLREHMEYLPEKAQKLAETNTLVSEIAKFPKKKQEFEKNGKKFSRSVTDPTKPRRFYPKMITNTKTGKFITKFYGPGDIEMNPVLQCLDVRGEIEPTVKIEYVYLGDSASVQIKMWDCAFTPDEQSAPKRLAPPNKTKPTKEFVEQTKKINEGKQEVDIEDASTEQDEKPKSKFPPKKFVKKVVHSSNGHPTKTAHPPKKMVKKLVKKLVKRPTEE